LSASAPTLTLRLRESPRLRAIGRTLHALAIAAVLALPAPPGVRASLAAAVLLLSLRAGRHRPDVQRVELAADGQCRVVDGRGDVLAGALGPGSLALPGLVVLDVRASAGRRSLWLAADAFSRDELRRLRMRIRVAA
jgi:hypothetical protein